MGFEVRSGERVIAGLFGQWPTNIVFDEHHPEAVSFEIITTTSIVALSDVMSQAMVNTAAWLTSDTFPTAAFVSDTVTPVGESSCYVAGPLIVRGNTVPIELAVTIRTSSATTMAEVAGQLDRTDFAIGSSFGPEIVNRLVTVAATAVFIP